MSQELQHQSESTLVSSQQLSKYLDLFQSTAGITQKEKEQFIEIAQISNLNPFKREIYITAYGEGRYRQCSIITGYEVYIKRAEMSGRLDGWKTHIEPCKSIKVSDTGSVSSSQDIKCVIEIFRKDFDHSFIHEVKLSEYIGKKKDGTVNQFWVKMPETMLRKVAISQGFRMCFNEILGGMPYTKEEMAIDIDYQDVSVKKEETKQESKEDPIKLMIDEAISCIPDCEKSSDLEALYESYPDIKNKKRWIDALREARELLDSKNQESKPEEKC